MKTLNDIITEVERKEDVLVRKLVIFVSPLTKDLDYRVAYFQSNGEASIWEDQVTDKYKRLDVTNKVYTDSVTRNTTTMEEN